MKRFGKELVAVLLMALGLAAPGWAEQFQAKVIRVLDGDTIEILRNGQPERIRLNGIDCPEKAQAFGQRARQFTAESCFGKVVAIDDRGRDRYGRTIGEVVLPDGRDLNHELVGAGMARWYEKYAPGDATLQRLEDGAKASKRGLWVDPAPMAPWDYRHQRRGGRSGFVSRKRFGRVGGWRY